MNVLGIDWGEAKVGLAWGSTEAGLAEPVGEVRAEEAVKRVVVIAQDRKIDRVVVGVSEGRSARRAKMFAGQLKKLGLKVELVDETLTTEEVVKKTPHLSGRKRAKREHAAAAAVILGNWLDDWRPD